jgi:hypothetical protein
MSNNLPKNTDENGRDENGRFTHGNNGKPKGATNKTTRDLREFITNFLNDKTDEITDIWDTLDNRDKLTLFLHLTRVILPKPPEEKNPEPIRPIYDFSSLTTEQIQELIDKL